MATIKQKKAFTFFYENLRNPKPIPLGDVLIRAGYSISQSKAPTQVTKSKGWQELLEETLPDDLLAKTHTDLLKTTRIDHMVFPLHDPDKPDSLSDDDIKQMLAEVNSTVRRIVHGEQARHVYFWVADAKSRSDALKLAYSIKGKMTPEDRPKNGDTYNTFLQQNNFNPNAPKARELADATLDFLMDKTKWSDENNTTSDPS